jgi:hypothetical protein
MLKLSGALGFAIAVIGCALSVDPVIPESEAMFDSRLLGRWVEDSSYDRASVSRAEGNTYAIEYMHDGKTSLFEARLGRMAERLVLDVWPAPRDGDLPEPYAGLLVGGHLLLALNIGTDEIRVATLDPDSLLAALRDGRVRLAHRTSEDQLILHGTTEELREALGPYLAHSGASGETDVWRRAPDAAPAGPVAVPCFEASAWREADQLFHRDPHWVGGDVASSVDLGDGRTLWLFGDSWIDPSGSGTRQGASMVSNSVAIQVGTDPTTAAISYYWGRAADGSPAPLFPDRGAESLWFGNGVRVRDRLLLFFAPTLRGTETGLGFEHVGWTAVMVENPDANPSAWRTHSLDTPTNQMGILVGFGAVIQLDEYVYALGSPNPIKSHPVYTVRWPAEQVHRGNLLTPEWWGGNRLGWVSESSSVPRWPLFENGQSEFTMHFDRATGRFLVVHTRGFGPADVIMRAAPRLTGPWSRPRMAYRPPEYDRPNVMIYAGKAHPQLTGADLVLTYATNTFRFSEHLTDSLIYYPRFVRLTRCR